jgi:hypothetical protein
MLVLGQFIDPELLPSSLNLEELFSPKANPLSSWVFFMLFFLLTLFAWLRISFPMRMELMMNAFSSNRFVSQITREERSSSSLFNVGIEVIYFLSTALFVFLLSEKVNWVNLPSSSILSFVAVASGFLLLSLLKSLAIAVFFWLFDMQFASSDLVFYRFLSHLVLGLIIGAICLFLAYSPFGTGFLVLTGIILYGLVFFYRLIRSSLQFLGKGAYSFKYIILYICALEILPVCIVAKYMFNTM